MSTFNEFCYGAFGGLIGQILCYPFDTIKTRLQYSNYNNNTKFLFKNIYKNGLKNHSLNLYKGLPSPLISVIVEKSLLFSSYNIVKRDNISPFYSGLLAGVITTLTVTPFERIKVRSQINNTDTLQTIKNIIKLDSISSFYRGWTATLFREVPGYGLYFYVYEKMKRDNNNLLYSFLTGSSCGITAWIFIYPSDPIKTVMQNDNIGFLESTKKIYNSSGILGFYKGYSWGLIRAGILHGGVFMGYEGIKNMF